MQSSNKAWTRLFAARIVLKTPCDVGAERDTSSVPLNFRIWLVLSLFALPGAGFSVPDSLRMGMLEGAHAPCSSCRTPGTHLCTTQWRLCLGPRFKPTRSVYGLFFRVSWLADLSHCCRFTLSSSPVTKWWRVWLIRGRWGSPVEPPQLSAGGGETWPGCQWNHPARFETRELFWQLWGTREGVKPVKLSVISPPPALWEASKGKERLVYRVGARCRQGRRKWNRFYLAIVIFLW